MALGNETLAVSNVGEIGDDLVQRVDHIVLSGDSGVVVLDILLSQGFQIRLFLVQKVEFLVKNLGFLHIFCILEVQSLDFQLQFFDFLIQN